MKRDSPEPGGGAERKASQAEKMAWAKAVWWEGIWCAGPQRFPEKVNLGRQVMIRLFMA